MSTVGELALSYLAGMVHTPAIEIEVLIDAGVDGFGGRKGALRSQPSPLRGTGYYDSSAAAYVAIAAARALKSQLVTVENDFGETWSDCLVLEARALHDPVPVLIDGDLQYQVDYEFDVLRQTV